MTTSAPATAARHAGSAPLGSGRWLALSLLSLAQLMLILDVTVVNVALPDIGAGLHLDRLTLTWVLTAYTLAFGGLMLLGGRLALAALPALVAGGRSRTSRAMVDMPGALAVTAATGAAIYGLISAGSHGWLTARTVVPLGAAVVLYVIFAAIEHIVAAPLMDVRMLTRRPVAAGAFVMLGT